MSLHVDNVEIHDHVLRDLTPWICAEVMRLHDKTMTTAPSLNVGGWKSHDDLFMHNHGVFNQLRAEITRYLQARASTLRHTRLRGWAMVNQRGSHHPRHDHRSAVVSGVYYADPGTPPSAPTVFELAGNRELCVDPVAGRLVLFPGSTFHRVPPYLGDHPRVTIAFDIPKEA